MANAIQPNSARAPAPRAPRLGSTDIEDLAAWALRLTGITLTERKQEFLASRLGRRLAATGSADYAAYLRRLKTDPDEHARFAEALTTHTTSFFREAPQFEWLRSEGLKALTGSRGTTLELLFWSAACSSGQEGYSALMVAEQARLHDNLPARARLLGTDISSQVLRIAAQAVYDRTQIRDIPKDMRPRFLLSSRKDDGRYRIVPDLRNLASWSQANLVSGDGLGRFSADLVFLRNVLIYFDNEMREAAIENVVSRLRPGGFLLLGHTEGSHIRHRTDLRTVRPSIFQKVGT
ncbi:CheR family methyltransferase [Citreimonas salinaria]|uniref:protein-glutamate O-methyltransferase n=1 Tax=Citreimonas salinaria TaxID=321339 RepID=A0A1H3MRW5_9RHOB|nr:protein-glutamate O-methyltransferase CheR [Citreimonas salinaria]SDY79204.1 chemotaxis protein methyltransferase CheR [Citreimonas salinaria]